MQENEMNKLVSEYLKNVKKKLPWWIKNDKKERIKLIEQLEAHIWEKAEDLSEYNQPTEDSVRLALAHTGTPNNIVREFDQGKTPKIFISTELWPIYKIIIIILFTSIILLNVFSLLSFVFSYIRNPVIMISENPLEFFDEEKIRLTLLNLYYNIVFFGAIGIVIIIFFWLSKRGYYPDNFKKHKKRIKREKKREQLIKIGMPISRETGEPMRPFINRNYYIFFAIQGILVAGMILVRLDPNQNILKLKILTFLIALVISIDCTIEAILGNKHVLSHQLVLTISISLCLLLVFIISITIWTTPDLIMKPFWFVISFILISIFLFLFIPLLIFRLKKLEKYKIRS